MKLTGISPARSSFHITTTREMEAMHQPILERLEELVESSRELRSGDCPSWRLRAWFVACQNAVGLLFANSNSPYNTAVDELSSEWDGSNGKYHVAELAAILEQLIKDAKNDLVVSIENRVQAEVLDDFIDTADSYFQQGKTMEAAVIAGVVFEDAIRRTCRSLKIAEAGVKLDTLISSLNSAGRITGLQAKRARVGAGVRTSATHARWEELDPDSVRITISIARDVLDKLSAES